MRWSIIRLIWFRELRDQLRDRRTVIMMAVLPLVLYPALGFGVVQFALSFATKPLVVGVYGAENLAPQAREASLQLPPDRVAEMIMLMGTSGGIHRLCLAGEIVDFSMSIQERRVGEYFAWTAWFAAAADGTGIGMSRVLPFVATLGVSQSGQLLPLPPLLVGGNKPYFPAAYFDSPKEAAVIQVLRLEWAGDGVDSRGRLLESFDGWTEAVDRTPLDSKQVDALLIVPPYFWERLEGEARPALFLMTRENDDRSRLLANRLHGVFARWKKLVREVRLQRHGLPASFDDPVLVQDNERPRSLEKRAAEELFEILVRVYPFILVMWSLAGALYPAVDLCAGEKERGTMETLLISPATRDEIVMGKFLTIWVFSAASALLNLASMGVTANFFGSMLPQSILGPTAIIWSVVLVLPLAAFFSAICLSVGAYARSTKEGQYYLMPLFLITMPLVFLTLAPGVELSPFYSLVPITGVALLLQKLMISSSFDQAPWLYFVPVLAPMVLYGWFALRWAIEQFKREEVLFREAERLDVGLWLRQLFRDKEPLPSTAQAMACIALIVILHWAAVGLLGGSQAFLGRSSVGLLAFVAAPPLFMALILTLKPRQGLGLRLASPASFVQAGLLAISLLLPLSEITIHILQRYPNVMELLAENNPLAMELKSLNRAGQSLLPISTILQYLLVLGVLPAVAEELAFRGFILTGLSRRFAPGTAIVFSSFLFALYHFNVFQLLPAFVLGLVLGTLAQRTGSVLPGMLFHMLHNGLLIGLVMLEAHGLSNGDVAGHGLMRVALVALSSCLAIILFRRIIRRAADDKGVNELKRRPDPFIVVSQTQLMRVDK
jgi:sodium transport system permease protein